MSDKDRKNLAELSVDGFLAQLGSGEPTPGGGAAAALSSALGAALLMMVANHTIGKSRYAEYEELNIEVRDKAEILRASLAEGIDRDAEAFLEVSAAFRLPKEDKEARSAAIGRASVAAAEAPLAVMRDSLAGLRLAASLPSRSNPNLLSDVLVAVHCLGSGLRSAAYNVDANLPAIRRADPELAEQMDTEKTSLLDEAARLAAGITTSIATE